MPKRRLLCLLALALAAAAAAEPYHYWQQSLDERGGVLALQRLPPVESAQPPTAEQPITVTLKPVEGAKSYRLLRLPTTPLALPTVTVKRPGDATCYYWLVGHAGRVRSPIAGPVVAANCAADQPENVLTWAATPPWQSYTLLRTNSPALPSGQVNCLLVWGTDKTTVTDTRHLADVLTDYPCYPQGTPPEVAPVGKGPFLVGQSAGEPIADTGKLTELEVAPARPLKVTDRAGGYADGYQQAVAGNPGRGGVLGLKIVNDQPQGRYDWGGPVGFYLDQTDIAGGHNDYSNVGGGPFQKSFHIPFYLWQRNYTAGQVASQVMFTNKYGEGDTVLFTAHAASEGLTEDGGDEGLEIIMSSVSRELKAYDYTLTATAPAQATVLPVGKYQRTGTGRVVVNLTQAQSTGAIVRIDDDLVLAPERFAGQQRPRQTNRVTRVTGEGTAWTPELAGWYLSLDCDTRADGLRQWYRVIRVNSPTSLDLYAYTFFSSSTYLGHAANVVYHGLDYRGGMKTEPRPPRATPAPARETYLLAPATTIADALSDSDRLLRVMPLKQEWHQGDRLQVVAGPQNTVSLGKFGINGKLLPQDYVFGMWFYNWSDRLSNDGALVVQGKWSAGLEVQLDDAGLSNGVVVSGKAHPEGGALVVPADTTALRASGVPVVLAGASEGGQLAFRADGATGPAVLAVGREQVTLGEHTRLAAGPAVRGRALLSPDGQQTRFTVAFPVPFAQPPHVVASANLPLAMGVAEVDNRQFTVIFATAPAAGQQSLQLTWIVLE